MTEQQTEVTRYILITQCLQNGFFLSADNRLCLPEEEVYRMLIGKIPEEKSLNTDEDSVFEVQGGDEQPIQRRIRNARVLNWRRGEQSEGKANQFKLVEEYENGPLYSFLDRAIAKPERNKELHVINIRDWHTLSDRYDKERRLYGRHCEANTWEAESLRGFDKFLQPWKDQDGDSDFERRTLKGYKSSAYEKVRFYEVLSDTVYDFKRSSTVPYTQDVASRLDNEPISVSHLSLLLDELLEPNTDGRKVRSYVVVIGVYTDIKIKTLLMGLRSRYDINNLIVSDILTGAPTLGRNLEALDFFDKVLNVEIISNLNSLVSVLDDEQPNTEEEPIPIKHVDYSREWRKYRNYFLDQQKVLATQDQQLEHYMRLTTRRSLKLYNTLNRTNNLLQILGLFSILLLVLMIVSNVWFGYQVPLQAMAFTSLVSLGGILPNLIIGPQERMQSNLMRLVRLRNYLESYSMTTSLLRHHLTEPERLKYSSEEAIEKQLQLISEAAKALRENFEDLAQDPRDKKSVEDNGSQDPENTDSPDVERETPDDDYPVG